MASSPVSDDAGTTVEPYSPDSVQDLKRLYRFLPGSPVILDTETLETKIQRYDDNLKSIQEKWVDSPQRASLIDFIEEKILPMTDLDVDSALCLGLGPLDQLYWPEYFTHEISGERGRFWADNFCFIQLLVFETVVDTLKRKFDIKHVMFQDPAFHDPDQAFLERRGHTVVPFPASEMTKATFPERLGFGARSQRQLSSNTFLFCPFLDRGALVEAAAVLKPKLYLGTDFLIWAACFDLASSKYPTAELWQEFEDFAWSRDYEPVPILCGLLSLDQGFHWQRDLKDEVALKKLRERYQALEVEHAPQKKYIEQRNSDRAARRENPSVSLEMIETHREILRLEKNFRALWAKAAEEDELKAKEGAKAQGEVEKK
ncbi:hypothetical protein MMC25_001688 [Agyrium rufum]|nr:hypothetical protein [Agyrium rufum]